MTNELKLM